MDELVEIIQNSVGGCARHWAEIIADGLIAHGVTVQEMKPLEAFLHPVDAYKGLKAKYLVFKADTGKQVDNCFILRPDKDPAAVEALRAYASATDNETLAEDIYNWIGKGEPVQEWISVKDRFPEKHETSVDGFVLGYTAEDKVIIALWSDVCRFSEFVTHWMPLPKPPKGE